MKDAHEHPATGAGEPNAAPFLVGNSFPLSLVRRSVRIDPIPLDAARRMLVGRRFLSYWGHENTLHAAGELLGVDLSPRSSRPAVSLDCEDFPSLEGVSCREVLVIAPDYVPGFRPAIGAEVSRDQIKSFQTLLMNFL